MKPTSHSIRPGNSDTMRITGWKLSWSGFHISNEWRGKVYCLLHCLHIQASVRHYHNRVGWTDANVVRLAETDVSEESKYVCLQFADMTAQTRNVNGVCGRFYCCWPFVGKEQTSAKIVKEFVSSQEWQPRHKKSMGSVSMTDKELLAF